MTPHFSRRKRDIVRNIVGNVLEKLRGLTKQQKIILSFGGAIGLIVLCIGIGLLCYPLGNEQTGQTEKEDEIIVIEEQEVESQEDSVPKSRKISFLATSVEKDAKIKIVDETEALVTGVAFRITITSNQEEQGKEYADEDMDGIIHITELNAGEYTVRLHETEGFVIAENPVSVVVKDKIEYKKVDVKNEIKKESEVNVKKEDALTQKPQQSNKEESKVEDTVKYVKSSKNEIVVAKENVDYSDFPSANVSENRKQETIVNGTTVTVPESAMLYSQGGEQSRKCLITAEIGGQQQSIHKVGWKENSSGVFTFVQESETSVLLMAEQEGTTELSFIVEYEDGFSRSLQSKEIKISVTVSPLTDDKTQMKDKEGYLLYLDKENKQPAMIKDYHADKEFYTTKYTGWQTIGDNKYYFDENCKAVTGTQIIEGVRYRFNEDGTIIPEQKGIDVSKWNGTIDWNAVAKAGIDFAIIRVGYRGYSAGTLVEDPYFKDNIKGAAKAGIKVGLYFYSQAITEIEAVEEASMAISLVSGYKLQLPIYFDTEYVEGGRANSLTASDRTAITKAFCETVRNAGYKAGIYSNYYWLRDNLNMSELNQYYVWVAHYAEQCGYPGKYDMWQYTSSGSVSGIKGRVDMNISYVTY